MDEWTLKESNPIAHMKKERNTCQFLKVFSMIKNFLYT